MQSFGSPASYSDFLGVSTHERSKLKMHDRKRHEASSIRVNPLYVTADGKLKNNSQKTKRNPNSGSGEKGSREKIVEIRQLDMNYGSGMYEFIANDSKDPLRARKGHEDQAGVHISDSFIMMAQTTQQQMNLLRRMMYLLCLVAAIVFLTAAASLSLTMIILKSEKLNLFQRPNSFTDCSSKGRLEQTTMEISELKRELNITRHQLETLKLALTNQRKAVANLTSQETTSCNRCVGPQGPPGQRGPIGPQGTPGIQGLRGPPGPMGPRGFNGSAGQKGAHGLQGVMGPQGYNGSQGRTGVPGLAGQPGSPGIGNVSACQYKNKTEQAQSKGDDADSIVLLREDENQGWKIVGATCSTDGAAEYAFRDAVVEPSTGTIVYSCRCKGESSVFPSSSKMVCVLHYWMCPMTS